MRTGNGYKQQNGTGAAPTQLPLFDHTRWLKRIETTRDHISPDARALTENQEVILKAFVTELENDLEYQNLSPTEGDVYAGLYRAEQVQGGEVTRSEIIEAMHAITVERMLAEGLDPDYVQPPDPRTVSNALPRLRDKGWATQAHGRDSQHWLIAHPTRVPK